MTWTRRHTRALWLLLAAGTLARALLAWRTGGVGYDLDSFRLVDEALRSSGLDAYSAANESANRWPYPPGFFPAILAAGELDAIGLSFRTAIRMPAILADAGIAWLVQDMLGRRGAAPGLRLAAAATVALGPSFALISGYHGQIDSVAILPAAAALWVWTREDVRSRALWAGLLIGAGCAVKTAPIVMLLALLPTVRSPREAAVLVTSAAAVPLALVTPFLAADPSAVADALTYRGAPGLGGISLLLQPGLPEAWIAGAPIGPSSLTSTVRDIGGVITAVALLAVGVFLLRQRARPFDAALVVWLVVYVAGVNFFIQYLVWGLPFLIARGNVRAAIALQAALLPATVLVYGKEEFADWPGPELVRWVYTPSLIAFWLGCVAALVLLMRQIARGTPRPALR